MIPYKIEETLAMQSYAAVCYAKDTGETNNSSPVGKPLHVVKFSHQFEDVADTSDALRVELDLFSTCSSDFFVPALTLHQEKNRKALRFQTIESTNLGKIYTELSRRGVLLSENTIAAMFLNLLEEAVLLQKSYSKCSYKYVSIFITAGIGNLFVQPTGSLSCTGVSEILPLDQQYLSPVWSTLTPPEMIIPGKPVSHQTDVYSAGAMLFHLLTGHLLFNDRMENSRDKILSRMYRSLHPIPSDVRGDASVFDAICLKCLQFSPEDRYANLEELALDIKKQFEIDDLFEYQSELKQIYKDVNRSLNTSELEEESVLAYSSF